jgi:hypothetical protein
MTALEILRTYEALFSKIVNCDCTAEEDTLYHDGIYPIALKAALVDACERGDTCGAELAETIKDYPHVQYAINLQFLRS